MMNYSKPSEKIMSASVLHSKRLSCSSDFYFVPEINLSFSKSPLCLFPEINVAKTYLLYMLPSDSLLDLNSDFN